MKQKQTATSKKTFVRSNLMVWIITAITLSIGAWLIFQKPAIAEEIVVYKSPTCGCCNDWIKHLKENGFSVEAHNKQNMSEIKNELGVPRRLQSCHTAKVNGYVIEGHVPADLITKMLREKPQIKGLSVPGMPMGSPGMEGPRKDDYDIVMFSENGKTSVYASR
ncbi:MAG: DUF411 domain-containing protein [Sedimenticola sp.]